VDISEESIVIERPVPEVFAFVSNTTNDPLWHTTVVEGHQTSEGPVGLGTTFEGTYDSHRKTLTTPPQVANFQHVRATVTAFVADRAVTIRVEFVDPPRGIGARVLGRRFDLSFRFEEAPGGTRVYRGGEVDPMPIVRPILPLFMRANASRNRYLLANLKAAVEGGDRRPPSAGNGSPPQSGQQERAE
jgi:hypothetical protein